MNPLTPRSIVSHPRPASRLGIWVALAVVLSASPQTRAEESAFAKFQFGNDISIEVPRNWYFLDKNLQQHLKTSAESMFKLGGFDWKLGGNKILVAANAYTTYKDTSATMRLSVEAHETLTQDDVAAASQEELDELGSFVKNAFLTSAEKSGEPHDVEGFKTTRQKLGPHQAIVMEYLRISKNTGKRVFVQVHTVHLGDRSVKLTMSCREAERPFFRPVLLAIRNSLTIR